MEPPKPEPIRVDQLPELALAAMRVAKFPMLASIDGDRPRVRPVSPVYQEGFVIYVANLRSYDKTAQIEANPKVELCYLEGGHDQVRIEGRAEVLEDSAMLETIWESNALLRRYLGSPDNPQLLIYKVVPERVRFMREWALEYHEVPIDSV